VALTAVSSLMIIGCGRIGSATSPSVEPDHAASAPPPPVASTGPAPTTETTSTTGPLTGATPDDPVGLCQGLESAQSGTLASSELAELSGLARSERDDTLLWAHNDSGNAVVLHALDTTGADRGTVAIEGTGAVDIEDIAIAQGLVWLADIGDNDRHRDTIAIHRFPEPSPGTGTVAADQVETIRFRYPDGPHDAEAFAVDPIDGTVAIITKEIAFGVGENGTLVVAAPAPVFTASAPFDGAGPHHLDEAGTVALDALDRMVEGQGPEVGPVATYGGAGVATAADIRADGAAIAVRTYEAVWLFPRAEGTSVAEALAGEPCSAPVAREPQGEAVAFLDATDPGFVTASEGDPAIHVTSAP
jgi:hypothetical protein